MVEPSIGAIVVALPAYNEEAGLPLLLQRWTTVLRPLGRSYRFVVVDDGSTDRTPSVLKEFAAREPLRVITHQPNQGLGPTLRDALIEACRNASPNDVIVTMDADNTHPPELFPLMLERLERESRDLVIASRFQHGADVVGLNALRRWTSQGARLLFQLAFCYPGVRDYTCGYRAYRAELLQRAIAHYGDGFCDQRGFTCMADVLLKLLRLGARSSEVGMILRYDRKQGPSRMRVARTIWMTLALVFRHRLAPASGSRPATGRRVGDKPTSET